MACAMRADLFDIDCTYYIAGPQRVVRAWRLQPLNPAYPATPLPDLAALRGVVIQKALPGRRRASKRYV
jgi:hypothetical protein